MSAMDPAKALTLMRFLGAAFYFDEDSTKLWVTKLAGLADEEAAWKAAHAIVDDATDRHTPAWGAYRPTYDRWARRHEELATERRLALGDGTDLKRGGVVPPGRGAEIALEAYRREYGREPASGNIWVLPDPEALPPAAPEDMDIVERVCKAGSEFAGGWMSRYTEVYRAMGRDHLRARAACRAMERSQRLVHRNNGVLVLLR